MKEEIKEICELLKKLPEERQKEIYLMIMGAALSMVEDSNSVQPEKIAE